MYQSQQNVPDSTVRPIYPTYLTAWLDHLGAYDTCQRLEESLEEGQDPDLDMMRQLWQSDSYYPQLIPFPVDIVGTGTGTGSGNILNFNPGETKTGSIQISDGSYLVSAGCYVNEGTDESAPTGAGAKVRIYDKATQSDLFYQQFAHAQDCFGTGDNGGAINPDMPFGPYLPRTPFVISTPGIIQWEITNLDPVNPATIQVLLSFAVPKGSVSGNVVVQEEVS